MITLADGRVLCLEIGGDVGGTPIVVHHGMPNSRHLYPPAVRDAACKGAYLVSWDRPGYGSSDPQPGRTVADVTGDLRQVAEFLGADRVLVWGISGGGPHALACAALLPDVVSAVAALASLAPVGAEDLDYYEGMGDLNVEDMQLFESDREAARKKLRQDWEELRAADPDQMIEGMSSLLTETDRAAFTGEVAEWLMASEHDGLAPGDEGWWEDAVATAEPWGFAFDEVRVPVKIWHGHQDRFVPVGHGTWLAGHVPGAESEISETDGHLTLLHRIGEVHDWLLARW